MSRVIRLTEQQLTGLLGSLVNMIMGDDNKKQSDTPDVKKDGEQEVCQETDSKEIGNISSKGQELLKNPIFKKKLKEISQAINIDENSIIKLMKHESGLDPKIKNSWPAATGFQVFSDINNPG
jgi:hypothetical protein